MVRSRVGIGIGRSEVRAVVLGRGRIIWRAARPVADESHLEDVLVEMLRTAPLGGFPRPVAFAVVGPSAAQVKRLIGIPAVSKPTIASGLVSANIARFFLRSGAPVRVTPAFRSGDHWWAAAVEEPVVAAVQRACGRLRLRLEGCQPAAAALARSVRTGAVGWSDGAVRVTLHVCDGVWQDVKRERCEDAQGEPNFADAVAATRASIRGPLVLRSPAGLFAGEPSAARVALYALALATSAGAYLAPGLAAARAVAAAELRSIEGGASTVGSAPAVRELNATTAGLAEIVRFASGRRPVTQLLGGLARALPESTAILSLRTDSAWASITVVSTAASSVPPRLETVAGADDVRVTGAFTRETVGGIQLQRLGARFRLSRPE